MAQPAEPRPVVRYPRYTVAPDPPHGWRVTGHRGRRGRGGFPDRAAAEAHARRLAASHPVAGIRVLGGDGSVSCAERVVEASWCREAREWLEAYLSRFRAYSEVRARLVDDWYVESRPVEVAGAVVRLQVSAHEGQAWDEIHVHAALCDEDGGSSIVEVAFTLWGF